MGTHDVVTLGAIAKWFPNRKGIMTGVVKTGTAFGQMVMPIVAAVLLATYGWRDTVTILGLAAAVLLVVGAQFMSVPAKPRASEAQPMTWAKLYGSTKD